MKNSGEALLVIINDVLDYSKIEANKISLIEHSFDLKKMPERNNPCLEKFGKIQKFDPNFKLSS